MHGRLLKDAALYDKKHDEEVYFLEENPDGTVKVIVVKMECRDCNPEDLREMDGSPYGQNSRNGSSEPMHR